MSCFIHIPKTGGSTFVNLLQESLLNQYSEVDRTHHISQIRDVMIMHINFKHPQRISKSVLLFNDSFFEKYKHLHFFTIIRNPLDRLVSEYLFQTKNGYNKAIISKLHPTPNTFHEYVQHDEVHNYQVGFLSGRGVADSATITQDDLDNVIQLLEKYNFTVGFNESYSEFLKSFQSITGHSLNKQFKICKKADNVLKKNILDSLTHNDIKLIQEKSALDFKLYDYFKKKTN